MRRELAIEFSRVTEAAALAGYKWLGRGDKNTADGAAVHAMRIVLNQVNIDGTIVIGEGGSGGALALAAGNEVWMLENAIYAVLSPEGFASILWKDSKRASEAAAVMKLTAADLKKLGVIEAVIAEPEVYTEETMQSVVFVLQKKITEFLDTHCNFSPEELAAQRYERFRKM